MIVVLVMKLILPMRMMIEIMIVIVMAMLIMTRVKMIIMISIIITITKTMMHPSMKALTATFRLQLLNSIYTCKQTTSRPQDSESEIPYYQGSMLEIITLTLSVM